MPTCTHVLDTSLRRIFEVNLAPGGRVMLSDPFRATSFRLLEALEAEGWTISFNKWELGEEATRRLVGVFELIPAGRTN
jgi:methyltransferase-like protein 23